MTPTPRELARLVRDRALKLGFATAGIADLGPSAHSEALTDWLAQGMAGTMSYMHRQAARRRQPSTIVAGATRAVVVTWNYYQADPPSEAGTGLIARYARGEDYHERLRAPLEELAAYLRELGGPDTIVRCYVDAGPVPERELGQRAGLGWIGKNTMLIDPRRGSFFFIATVLTNLALALDEPFESDRCGSCTRCLDACPTDAFPRPRVLDSRRCISYLTIEYRGEVEPDLAGQMGDRIFGCDICQDVCPWNVSFAHPVADPGVPGRLNLAQLTRMTSQEFDTRFGDTALDRAGPVGLRRNAAIAIENAYRIEPCPAR